MSIEEKKDYKSMVMAYKLFEILYDKKYIDEKLYAGILKDRKELDDFLKDNEIEIIKGG